MYTPEDGDNWMLAKLNLQITDLGYAQIVEHLGKVNIITSFRKIIATHRIKLRPGIEQKCNFLSDDKASAHMHARNNNFDYNFGDEGSEKN